METEVKVANCAENRTKLAQDIVDSWDMDDLVQYAVDNIEENLGNCDAAEYDSEWRGFYDE